MPVTPILGRSYCVFHHGILCRDKVHLPLYAGAPPNSYAAKYDGRGNLFQGVARGMVCVGEIVHIVHIGNLLVYESVGSNAASSIAILYPPITQFLICYAVSCISAFPAWPPRICVCSRIAAIRRDKGAGRPINHQGPAFALAGLC